MESYLEDNRPTLDEVCMEYEECVEECPAYEFCHSKAESEVRRMTREEKQKAIDALKISAPVMAVTQEKFNDYIQTLNKVMDWLDQEPCEDCVNRQAVAEVLLKYAHSREGKAFAEFLVSQINDLPPVNPQEPTIKNDLADERCIDRWNIGDKEAEALSVKGKLQIRHRGVIHNIDLRDFLDDLANIPLVTLQKPKTGHWIKYDNEYFADGRLTPVTCSIKECSVCHTKIANFYGKMDYCLYCGAKMESEVEE